MWSLFSRWHAVTLEKARVLCPRSSEHMYPEEAPSKRSSAEQRSSLPQPDAVADVGEIDYESLPTNNLWQHLLAGAMAGMMEHCCMYPADCVKVTADACLVHELTNNSHACYVNSTCSCMQENGLLDGNAWSLSSTCNYACNWIPISG